MALGIPKQYPLTYLMWAALFGETVISLATGRYSTAFIGALTFGLSLLPILAHRFFGIRFPAGFVAATVFFIIATLFLGEVGGFYERYWWWDLLLHSGSAIGFGMIGTVLVILLLGGTRLEASAFLASVFAFTFALSIGALWEIFEYGMDQAFGLNMQKSGLDDTMGDLIVDCIGGLVGASAGYTYIKLGPRGRLSGAIGLFVEQNFRSFRRTRR